MTRRLPIRGLVTQEGIPIGFDDGLRNSSEVCFRPRYKRCTGISIDRGRPGVNDCRICVSFALAGVCAEDMDGMDERLCLG